MNNTTTNDKRQTTNDKRQTTNNKQQTTKTMNLKTILILIFVIGIFSSNSISQNITITDDEGYTAETSAMLDVKSLTKGMLVPRLTTIQRELISSPATGLLVFDINLFSFFYYNGEIWVNLISSGDYSGGINAPLFAVVNATGDTVFAVYPEGVRINVSDVPLKATGSKGGFAVGGFNAGKGLTNEFFRITPDSVRIYIDTLPSLKATGSKGGFAVGGFNAGKENGLELFRVTDDSVRIYVKNNPSKATGSKGGFAVGGFNAGKALPVDFMHFTPNNYFIGHQSGQKNFSGIYNSTMGYESAMNLVSGSYNTFIGYQSGYSYIGNTGGENVIIGYLSGYNTNSGGNSFIGSRSGQSNTGGSNNTFMGVQSGQSNISGSQNLYMGYQAGAEMESGAYNVYLGADCGAESTSGICNVYIGNAAGSWNEGDYNVFIGREAGFDVSTDHSHRLFIENTNANYTQALIYGEFDNNKLRFNANVGINYNGVTNYGLIVDIPDGQTSTYGLYVFGDTYTSGSYNSSDKRLKTNIVNLDNALEKVLKLRGVSFDWKTKEFAELKLSNEHQIGVIAQEVEELFPELIKEDMNGYKAVSYSKFTPILIEAIKEQQKIIENLKIQNLKNEKEINNLIDELLERIKKLEEK
ncbi:MAG: tail fiber domain-containing protein [Bacteroidales bacterium]|nr:tail fiber domain-containing protein [Bacteroidales bacterium]